MNDFNFRSLHHKIEPAAVLLLDNSGRQLFIKLQDSKNIRTIEAINRVWIEFVKNEPFEYDTLQDDLDRFYSNDYKLGNIVLYSCVLSFILLCIGLFSLSAYSIKRRSKEIAIRKVNGSSIFGIIILLFSEYSRMLIIAFIIACPISCYLLLRWLSSYEYRVHLDWKIFILSGILSYIIVVLTICSQSFKSASTNPAYELKNE
jgi:putative ABC transport system permease protein